MRKFLCMVFACIILTGCSQKTNDIQDALSLRNRLTNAQTCSFKAKITADYGDSVYTFVMQCQHQKEIGMQWELLEPDSIQGIKGRITEETGKFEFEDGSIVVFPLLADGYITPASAPWIFVRAILSGYIQTAGKDGTYMRTQIGDSFDGMQFTLDLWTNAEGIPARGDILWEGRRIVSIEITDFVIS